MSAIDERLCSRCTYPMKANGDRAWECLNPNCGVYQEVDAELPASREASGIDEVRRAIRSTPVEADPSILPTQEMIEEMRRLAEEDPEAFKRMLAEDLERQFLGESAHGFLSVFEDPKRDRHRRLFGHPLARVFVSGDRLLVVHPQGGAA